MRVGESDVEGEGERWEVSVRLRDRAPYAPMRGARGEGER